MRPFRWGDVTWPVVGAISALVLARAALYLHLGVRHVLDDYDLLYLSDRFGVAGFITDYWRGRPVAGVVDALLFQGVGSHPLVLFAIVTVLNLAAALLLLVVLRRFVSLRTAGFVTALWVLSANHTSLTVWTATAPTVMALVLLLGGVLLLTAGRWAWAALAFALAALSYELVVPVCLVAAMIVPSAPRVSGRQRLATAAPTLGAAIWVLLHPVYEDTPFPDPDVSLLWRAHFSDGLLGTTAGPDRLVYLLGDLALLGLVGCAVAWLLGDRDREDGPWLALTGLAVMVAGSAGFLRVGLGFQAAGLFGPLLAVSPVRAAMVLVGIAQLVWRRSRPVAFVGAVGLTVAVVAGLFVSMRSWSAAGADVTAALAFVDATRPADGQVVDVAIGPYPRGHNGVPSSSSTYDMLMIANRLRSTTGVGEVRTVDGGTDAFVAQSPGERLIDWRWIDNARRFDEGVGFVASVTVSGPEEATVYGWVEDGAPDADPVEVSILVDGQEVATTTADRAREDLAAAVGRPDPNHAFEATVEVAPGEHTVCARTVGHGSVPLGCEEVDVLPLTSEAP